MNTYTYKTNINCNNCIQSVTPFLNALDNVDTWSVDTSVDDKILTVVLDDEDTKAVITSVQSAGFSIEPI